MQPVQTSLVYSECEIKVIQRVSSAAIKRNTYMSSMVLALTMQLKGKKLTIQKSETGSATQWLLFSGKFLKYTFLDIEYLEGFRTFLSSNAQIYTTVLAEYMYTHVHRHINRWINIRFSRNTSLSSIEETLYLCC